MDVLAVVNEIGPFTELHYEQLQVQIKNKAYLNLISLSRLLSAINTIVLPPSGWTGNLSAAEPDEREVLTTTSRKPLFLGEAGPHILFKAYPWPTRYLSHTPGEFVTVLIFFQYKTSGNPKFS